jgi:nuclear pore complex protein Nup133
VKVYIFLSFFLSLFKATFCKEFVLPPTELYHSAKLVCLVGAPGGDSRQFGVLAVSPEGLVCYWPSMMYESSPVETETELVGQEFHSLIEFQVIVHLRMEYA